MLRSELMDLINECEGLFPVNEWVIADVHVWPLIRNGLFFDNADEYRKLYSSSLHKTKITRRLVQIPKIISSITRYFYAYFADHKKNAKVVKSCDVVLLSGIITFSWLDHIWYEKFCDPIIDAFRAKNISCFLMTPGRKFLFPRYSSSTFIQPRLDLNRMRGLLLYGNTVKDYDWLVEFQKMNDYLASRHNTIILTNLNALYENTISIRYMSEIFKKIFKQINPSVGLLVAYYSLEGMAFNLACRDLGIPSVDLQHGLQGDLHVAYGRWKSLPQGGYELLPSMFWCWSNYEAASIKKWFAKPSLGHSAFVGGNLFLEMWRSNIKNDIVGYYDENILLIKNCLPNVTHILYTLEGNEEIDKLRLMIKIMRKLGPAHHWWIRLHPGFLDQRKMVMKILSDNDALNYIEINAATDFPLYALLRHMDVHVTTISSVVIEAEAFGVPSVLLDKLGPELFEKQILSGWAIPAFTVDTIMLAIETQVSRKALLKKKSDKIDLLNNHNGIDTLVKIIKESN